jgi:hypothetical protein
MSTAPNQIAEALGTRRWVVAPRWTAQLRARYDVRLSQAEFTKLKESLGL